MQLQKTLEKAGLNDKEAIIYNVLLSDGANSVRSIADKTEINRGTTYDILKSLLNKGLVTYYHEATKQKFIAEDPQKLQTLIETEKSRLTEIGSELSEIIPRIRSQFGKLGVPITRFYEGEIGINSILNNVLETMDNEKKKEYLVFSSLNVRKHLYKAFPDFTKKRVAKNIKVKVISIGKGYEEEIMASMLAERKWMTKKDGSPTFIIIYGGKTAFISVTPKGKLHGTIVEDENIYSTEVTIFNHLWNIL